MHTILTIAYTMMFVILDGRSSLYGTLMDMTKYLSTYVALGFGWRNAKTRGHVPGTAIKHPQFLGDGGLGMAIYIYITTNICSCL